MGKVGETALFSDCFGVWLGVSGFRNGDRRVIAVVVV